GQRMFHPVEVRRGRCESVGMRPGLLLCFVGFTSFGLAASTAYAGDPAAFTLDLPPSAVYGGDTVPTCGWPTTVSMEGSCTGTLVHPELVIYAAHCGSGYNQVRLGENINGGTGGRSVKTEFCRTYPGGQPGNGSDFAFC